MKINNLLKDAAVLKALPVMDHLDALYRFRLPWTCSDCILLSGGQRICFPACVLSPAYSVLYDDTREDVEGKPPFV